MAKYNVRLIVPFEGRIHYHEGLLVRAVISLKILYDSQVNVIIATSTPHFVDAIHGSIVHRYPIMVMDIEQLVKFNISGYSVITTDDSHPFLKTKYGSKCSSFIVPSISNSISLSFNSVFFNRSFKYPDLTAIENIIPPDIKIKDKISMVMR